MKTIFTAKLDVEMTSMTQYGRPIDTKVPKNMLKPLKVEIDEHSEVMMIEDGFIFDTKKCFIARPQINDSTYMSINISGLWLQLFLENNKQLVVNNNLGNGIEVSYWYNLS